MIWRNIPLSSHAVRRVDLCSFFAMIWAACLAFILTGQVQAAETKKIVFIAGPPSHGPGEHEHRAGCLLLKSCLDKMPGIVSTVYSNGWPPNADEAFAGAAAVVVYSDGGPGHPLLKEDRLKTVDALMKNGVG